MTESLLPTDSLRGECLGISVSDSPDLARLGLFEEHVRLAIGGITRSVVGAGGELLYGGHLAPDGHTTSVLAEVRRCARRDRPLRVCLAWPEHRRLPSAELKRFRRALGLFGRLVCLDPAGAEVEPTTDRGEAPDPVTDARVLQPALTGLRCYMRQHQHGRVFLGGRRQGFRGQLPGVLEEALLTLEAGQPIYLAGGFGGATLDIARALGVDDGAWLPAVDDDSPDPRYADNCRRLAELAKAQSRRGLDNGLSVEENRKLAVTHRPSEIAALVSLGLGRRARAAGD